MAKVPDQELSRSQTQERQTASSSGLEKIVNKPLVLIVDGDRYIRQLAQFFLEEGGYSVSFADDGYTALDRIRLDQPALVLTEILLPHLDGLSLCRLLKSDPITSKVPVIVYTVLTDETRALESGADAFLKKPIEKTRLLDLVNSLKSKSVQEDA